MSIGVQMMAKAKPGPKLKDGPRYPSGKRKPENHGPAPARVARAVELILHKAGDPMLEGPVGWLRLHDCLTNGQVAAAAEYAKIVGEWDSLNGLPRRFPACQSYEVGYGRGEGAATPKKAAQRARKRFDDACAVARGAPPSPASIAIKINIPGAAEHRITQIMNDRHRVLDGLVLYQIHPFAQDMPKISDALFRLEKHFHLTGIWKSVKPRN